MWKFIVNGTVGIYIGSIADGELHHGLQIETPGATLTLVHSSKIGPATRNTHLSLEVIHRRRTELVKMTYYVTLEREIHRDARSRRRRENLI